MLKARSTLTALERVGKMIAIFVLLTLSLLAVLLMSGCDFLDNAFKASPEQAAVTSGAIDETPQDSELQQIAIALDVSGSTADSFAEDVRNALAEKVASYIPKKPASKAKGVAMVDGLRIVVYLIDSLNPNQYGEGNNIIGEIPKIPALPPLPEIPDEGITADYLDADTEWKLLAAAWEEAYDASIAKAEEVSGKILSMNLKAKGQGNASGIYNTVCAVINAATGNIVNVGVFSDLLENGTDRGAPPSDKSGNVVFCVPAPDGDVVAANERAKNLSQTMESWGFSSATVYNPDLLSEAVGTLFSR